MKTCFKCLTAKPITEFYKHAAMGDGRLGKCKECTKKDVLEHRLANLQRIRAYDRMRATEPHRLQSRIKYTTKYRAEHPNRMKANQAVTRAVRAGKLKKQPCWVCGEKALAHHPDYDRPLDVVWLCQPHHKQAHALVANDHALQEAA